MRRALAAAGFLLVSLAFDALAEPGKSAPPKPSKPVAVPSAVLAPQAPLDPRAFELNQQAVELYRAGEYRKAIAKLDEARKYHPDAKELLHNLATVYEKLAEVEPAIRFYQRYLEVENAPKARERAEAALRRLEGARKDLVKASAPDPPPPPRLEGPRAEVVRPSPLVFAGIALAGTSLLVGTALGIAAFFTQPSGRLRTGDGVTYQELLDQAETAHAQAVAADVFFALGLATGVATVVVHIVTRPGSPKVAGAAKLALRPSSPGLGLAVSF